MQLDVDCVDVVNGERPDTEAERDTLYFSIRELGLLQPIVVTEDPDVPGRYRVISGRRRLNAVRRLGLSHIEATVRTFDEIHREMAEIAENLHRLDLTRVERDKAFKRYHDLFLELHPELAHARPEAESEAESVRKAERKSNTAAARPVKRTAEKFGVTEGTVHKAIKRVEALTDDQRRVLDACKMPIKRIDRIAAIPDDEKRKQVVNLIAANMDYDAAMKEVLQDEWEGVDSDGEDVSDEEFLSSLKIRKRVNQQRFDADAILYRRIQRQKIEFARAIGWTGIKSEVGSRGIYFRRLVLFLEAKHPRDWLVCHNCTRGQTKNGDCPDCKGGGYVIG